MARDDELDDDRPRRRQPPDGDDDRPSRRRWGDEDDGGPPPRKKSGAGLVIGIVVGVFVLCCGGAGVGGYFFVRGVKKAAEGIQTVMQEGMEAEQSRRNLTEIGSAVLKYEAANQTLPNNSFEVGAKGGRPLLSWRVHLLPYLGEDQLYKQFKLDEPWDSPNNKPLLARMPRVYGSPQGQAGPGDGKTYYRGFSAPGGIFEKPQRPGDPVPRIKITDVTDGTSNTILVIDSGEAVEWTRPDDLDFSPGRPKPALGGAYPNYPFVMVLLADGTVHQLNRNVPDDTLRLYIDRKDGKPIQPGWLQ